MDFCFDKFPVVVLMLDKSAMVWYMLEAWVLSQYKDRLIRYGDFH